MVGDKLICFMKCKAWQYCCYHRNDVSRSLLRCVIDGMRFTKRSFECALWTVCVLATLTRCRPGYAGTYEGAQASLRNLQLYWWGHRDRGQLGGENYRPICSLGVVCHLGDLRMQYCRVVDRVCGHGLQTVDWPTKRRPSCINNELFHSRFLLYTCVWIGNAFWDNLKVIACRYM